MNGIIQTLIGFQLPKATEGSGRGKSWTSQSYHCVAQFSEGPYYKIAVDSLE